MPEKFWFREVCMTEVRLEIHLNYNTEFTYYLNFTIKILNLIFLNMQNPSLTLFSIQMFALWGRSLYNRYVFFMYVLYILLILQVADTTSQWFAPMTSWVTLVQRDSTQALPWTSQCLSICSCPPCHSHSMDSQCQWVCQIISQSKSVMIHFWHTFYQTRYMK